ncbi:restriction endonuclease subunit S [Thioalkalivibrio sp. AKL17]|uniref:restriction endonuclease subunit S n=1 Tax=Thioalkalivibrio sp. AKL17 TaxID=1158160 RepID=UPI00039ED220|nr:restriction endonuclease subunit S [Thioalkalivibrio sp. AKL17]
MSFPKYPEYKDSGVQWLGKVPSHWSTRPLWTLFRRIKRSGFMNETLLSVYRDYGVIPKSSRADNFNKPSEDLAPYQLVEVGDLAINKMKAWQGSVAISNYRGIVSPAYFVYANENEEDARYLHYLFRCNEYTHGYLSRSKGIRVNQWDLEPQEHSRMEVLLPPRAEQVQIATFLNHETGKIDALIEEQRRLIELLKEKRQAVISHAVTKGLDPNVPMKDSGVEWLGEVPAHWDVVPLRRAVEWIQTGGTPSQDSFEEEPKNGIPWFTPGDFGDDLSLHSARKSVSHESIVGGESKVFPILSVLVVGIGATLGKVAISEIEFSANQQINVVIPSPHVSGRFLAYSLSVKSEPMKLLSNASTIGIINQQKTKEIWVCIPPTGEQEEIERDLRRITSQIDALLSGAYEAIELLEERRSALISAAVTGKIDVRGWSAGAKAEAPGLAMVAEDRAEYSAQGGGA